MDEFQFGLWHARQGRLLVGVGEAVDLSFGLTTLTSRGKSVRLWTPGIWLSSTVIGSRQGKDS